MRLFWKSDAEEWLRDGLRRRKSAKLHIIPCILCIPWLIRSHLYARATRHDAFCRCVRWNSCNYISPLRDVCRNGTMSMLNSLVAMRSQCASASHAACNVGAREGGQLTQTQKGLESIPKNKDMSIRCVGGCYEEIHRCGNALRYLIRLVG